MSPSYLIAGEGFQVGFLTTGRDLSAFVPLLEVVLVPIGREVSAFFSLLSTEDILMFQMI